MLLSIVFGQEDEIAPNYIVNPAVLGHVHFWKFFFHFFISVKSRTPTDLLPEY
jgi:hypothetical protein